MNIDKNKRSLTRGHKTLGAKWLFELRFSHQSSLYLDSVVAPKSPTFHTAKRYKQAEEKTSDRMKMKFLLHKNKEEKSCP
jgi:hypothetical protein